MRGLTFVSLQILLVVALAKQAASVIKGTFGNKQYTYVQELKSWDSAQKACLNLGLQLASAHTLDEFLFLQRLTQSAPDKGKWIGGKLSKGRFIWTEDSSAIVTAVWRKGEPNGGTYEQCTEFSNSIVGLNDWVCSNALQYICVGPIPPTTTTKPPPSSGAFICRQEGKFPNPVACNAYHVCSKTNGVWTNSPFTCSPGFIFCKNYGACYFQDDVNCPCSSAATTTTPTPKTTTSTTTTTTTPTTTSTAPTTTPITTETTTKIIITEPITPSASTATTLQASVTNSSLAPTPTADPALFSCKERPCGLYSGTSLPGECSSSFFVCGEDKTVVEHRSCPHGLLFNPETSNCDLPEFVSCNRGTSTPTPSVGTTTTPTYTTTTTKLATNGTTVVTETTTTNQTPGPFKCEAAGYFGDTLNCSVFHNCVENPDGISFTDYSFSCPGELIWCQGSVACSFNYQCDQPCVS